MAQIYKALQDFELDGVQVRSGQEIACRAREAEELIKEKKLVVSDRELDLNDPKDIALKAAADLRAGKKNKDLNDEVVAREVEKNTREAEKDAVRAEKIKKATELSIQKRGEPHAAIEGMSEAELDNEIEGLEQQEDFVPPNGTKETTNAPKRTRTAH